jgi:hypothetical protein
LNLRNEIDHQVSLIESPLVLLSVSPVSYQDAVLDVLRYFSERFGSGLYITLNRPTATLKGSFEKAGIHGSKLLFLDSITNIPEHDTESCCFLGRMRELTDLSMGVSKMVSERKAIKFVLLDSVSTLLIYNDPKSVARFCHLVAERLRKWGLPGAFICVEMGEGMDTIAQLAQFCDAYVKGVG